MSVVACRCEDLVVIIESSQHSNLAWCQSLAGLFPYLTMSTLPLVSAVLHIPPKSFKRSHALFDIDVFPYAVLRMLDRCRFGWVPN